MRSGKLFRVGYNCVAWPIDKHDLKSTKQVTVQDIEPKILKYGTMVLILSVNPLEKVKVSWSGNDPGFWHPPWLVLAEDKKTYFIKSSGCIYTDITPFTNERGDTVRYFDENMNLVDV